MSAQNILQQYHNILKAMNDKNNQSFDNILAIIEIQNKKIEVLNKKIEKLEKIIKNK